LRISSWFSETSDVLCRLGRKCSFAVNIGGRTFLMGWCRRSRSGAQRPDNRVPSREMPRQELSSAPSSSRRSAGANQSFRRPSGSTRRRGLTMTMARGCAHTGGVTGSIPVARTSISAIFAADLAVDDLPANDGT
jgi:hypothetical protein